MRLFSQNNLIMFVCTSFHISVEQQYIGTSKVRKTEKAFSRMSL